MKSTYSRSSRFRASLWSAKLFWSWRIVSVGMAVIQLLTSPAWAIGFLAVSSLPERTLAAPPPFAASGEYPSAVNELPTASLAETFLPVANQQPAAAVPAAQNATVPPETSDLPVQVQTKFSDAPTEKEIFTRGGLLEPLTPLGKDKPAKDENKALAAALIAYRSAKASDPENVSALTDFLSAYPLSPWRAALLTNLGLIYRQTGRYTRALDAWEEAWKLAAQETQGPAMDMADRALSELAELNSRLGRQDRLQELLAQAEKRKMKGPSANRLDQAKSGFWLLQNQPQTSYRCGPYALGRILASQNKLVEASAKIVDEAHSTAQGTSLAQVAGWAKAMGMDYQMAKRAPGAEVVVPSVVHWKSGHFAAIVRRFDTGKYWVEDPTFGAGGIQVSRAALDEEASGYFLTPTQPALAAGWQSVDAKEGAGVWGKGSVSGRDPSPTDCHQNQTGGSGGGGGCSSGCNTGMPGYSVHTMLTSLHVSDTPVGYTPPVGPSIYFTVAYNQFEDNQLAGFQYSNFGPLWNFNWLSYIVIDASHNAAVHLPGGGTLNFPVVSVNGAIATYATNPRGQAALEQTSASSYALHEPDGSKIIYNVADASGNVFMKQIVDAQGNAATLHYEVESDPGADYPIRLQYILDAVNKVTYFNYNEEDDPYEIASISDPFGRTAYFTYGSDNGFWQLSTITDVVGLTSSFTYVNVNTLHMLTTPYGTTVFDASTLPGNASTRVLEITDPYGAKERWESWIAVSPIGYTEPVAPTGMYTNNSYLNYRNTFYWDKKAMLDDPGHPYSKAAIYHWLHSTAQLASPMLESMKKPLENRMWFNYPGQGSAVSGEGTSDQPIAIGRVLDDGSEQITKYEYNSTGHVTKMTDPAGRITSYDYDANGIDLLMVRQTTGSTNAVLEARTYDVTYPPHCPKTITDASKQTTTFEYYSNGQVHKRTNAKSETTTYVYTLNGTTASSTGGYLLTVTGPVTGSTTTYNYDYAGRRVLSKNSQNYQLLYSYDALDRPTATTYPDGTYTQTTYDRLDAEWTRDRLGRWSRRYHDALRHVVATQDPLGRITNFGFCLCGSMTSLTDPAGNVTRWAQDLQGRQISKTYADGSQTTYAYENTTSRLKSATDAMGQTASYSYSVDDKLTQTSYTGAAHPTSAIAFAYDANYNRLSGMTDSTGVTAYSYNANIGYASWAGASATTGAGRLVSETKTKASGSNFAEYTLAYGYDELGRQTSRSVDGSSNPSSVVYDSLGRVTSVTNPLGTFGYQYTSSTSNEVSLQYLGSTSGLRTSYSYDSNSGDRRLLSINNLTPSGSTISKFDYTYDAVGDIATWTQQSDSSTPQKYTLGYDAADELTSAVLTNTSTNAVLKTYVYGYDPAANRTSEQIDHAVTSATPNNLNQIASTSAGGPLRFTGTLSEPAAVTVGGNPAQVSGTSFTGYANVTPGTNTVAVSATDRSGMTTTNNYQVQADSAASRTLSYDLNGNMTQDGAGLGFEWDAANRLTAINYANSTNRSEFAYDGQGRRVQITEKNGTITPAGTGYQTYTTAGFTVAAGTHTLSFTGLNPQGGDNTVFIDDVRINGVTSSALGNSGFETPSMSGSYQYNPTGGSWTFAGDAGLTGNGSGFTSGNSNAPDGAQTAFVRNTGVVSQSVTLPAGTYAITFKAAQRGNYPTNPNHQALQVRLGSNADTVQNFVWIASTIAEKRLGSTIIKRYYPQGEKIGSALCYYDLDHRKSVRELMDSSGTVLARYDYDIYGRGTKTGGDLDADFGFAGLLNQRQSGLYYAAYRVYNPALGKWISRDRAGEAIGFNLYRYCMNNPILWTDLLGFECEKEQSELKLINLMYDIAARQYQNDQIRNANDISTALAALQALDAATVSAGIACSFPAFLENPGGCAAAARSAEAARQVYNSAASTVNDDEAIEAGDAKMMNELSRAKHDAEKALRECRGKNKWDCSRLMTKF